MAAEGAFAWWVDKQVAVVVKGDVVRGWVLTCQHSTDQGGSPVGQMTIVLLITDPAMAAAYPDTVVVDVLDDGGHGRPRNVLGLWAEDDLTDLHSTRTTPAPPPASD